MSLEAKYILHYENFSHVKPTPMEKDKEYLEKELGGDFTEIGWKYDVLYEPPKYTLHSDDIRKLLADQVLESHMDCFWRDRTPCKRNNTI